MDIEQKQSELIDHFVKQASAASNASAVASVIVEATSHPSLFAFAEILALPSVLQLETTENSAYLDMLRLFAHGTWSDFKSNADCLPQLIPDQILKLKQLTVLTLAETYKVLPYDQLMQELDVTNVRELEDFLINECMYAGIVRGKLDQLRRCFEVQFAAGRDLRPGQLGSMIQTLSNWLSTSENLLVSIQEKIKWADAMSENDKKHRKDVEERVEEVKKSLFKQGYPICGFGVLSDNVVVSALTVCCSLLLGYIGRRVLLTSWQKLHTVSRPTLTSEAMRRSALNLVE